MQGDPYETETSKQIRKKLKETPMEYRAIKRIAKLGIYTFMSIGFYGILLGVVIAAYYVATGNTEVVVRAAVAVVMLAIGFFGTLITISAGQEVLKDW